MIDKTAVPAAAEPSGASEPAPSPEAAPPAAAPPATAAAAETAHPSDTLIERWWEDHFPGSAVARDTVAWNVAFAAKETLKRLMSKG